MIKSPCLNICKIDPKSNLCIGCRRNIKEISNWVSMNDDEKHNLLLNLKDRVIEE